MAGLIVEDTRQREGAHDTKHAWWASHGVDVVRHKLETGDYMTVGSPVTVDTKAGPLELAMDLGRDHRRFSAECARARDTGLHLVVLVEGDPAMNDRDVLSRWPGWCSRCVLYKRRACHPSGGSCRRFRFVPVQGAVMARQMGTMEGRYGCEFRFCSKADAAREVCDLLCVDYRD